MLKNDFFPPMRTVFVGMGASKPSAEGASRVGAAVAVRVSLDELEAAV